MLGGVMTIRPTALKTSSQGFTLLSDLHLGCSYTDTKAIKRELDLALKNDDRILINGDLFDLILPSDHKRYQAHVVAEQFRGAPDVINKVVDFATDFLAPYAHLIDVVGVGNHDDQTKYISIDPVLWTINNLNQRLLNTRKQSEPFHQIFYGGYCGFVVYKLKSQLFSIYYHHGFGGGTSLSGAAGDLNKLLAQVEGVDLMWLGHKHQKVASHVSRIRPATKGDHPAVQEIHYVRTGAYLRAAAGQSQQSIQERGRQSIYSVDKGYPFSGLGGARVLVDVDKNGLEIKVIQ